MMGPGHQRAMPWHAPPEGERPQNWGTPRPLFLEIERRYAFGSRFTLDAAASSSNAKCARYFSEENDAFDRERWAELEQPPPVVWLNPPYDDIERWMRRAVREVTRPDWWCDQVVMLVPARCSMDWYHELAKQHAARLEFIHERVHFDAPPGTEATQPFEHSLIVSFERKWTFSDAMARDPARRRNR